MVLVQGHEQNWVHFRNGGGGGEVLLQFIELCVLQTQVGEAAGIGVDILGHLVPALLKVGARGVLHGVGEETTRLGDGLAGCVGDGAREGVDMVAHKVHGEVRVEAEQKDGGDKLGAVGTQQGGDVRVAVGEVGGEVVAERQHGRALLHVGERAGADGANRAECGGRRRRGWADGGADGEARRRGGDCADRGR
ncbi:vegetative cell wall protein gp1 [Gracilaria domingensis]|nr:vegetative cell wall protein gp1 [Gracilaria domingensis]